MSDELHFVYIIATVRDGAPAAPIKAGITKSVAARFATIKTSSPSPLELFAVFPFPERYDVQRLETAFQKVMSRHRVHGEWFDMEPKRALAAMLANIQEYLVHHIGLERQVAREIIAEMGFTLP